MKKIIILMMLASIVCSGCTAEKKEVEAMENKQTLYLVDKAVTYNFSLQDNDWRLAYEKSYEYENGYPSRKTVKGSDGNVISEEQFAYTFENGVPLSCNKKETSGNETVIEYTNGRIDKSDYHNGDIYHKVMLYQYANNDDYFTLVFHSSFAQAEADDGQGADCGEEVDEIYIEKADNGLLKKTVNHGLYSNWIAGEDRIWYRFNGTYMMEYDEDGIVHTPSAVFRAGPPSRETVFEVTKENGLISEVVRKAKNDKDEWVMEAKTVFSYSDVETEPVRYAQMINDLLMEGGNTYYLYNWY